MCHLKTESCNYSNRYNVLGFTADKYIVFLLFIGKRFA